jgi:hypothetical protein
MAKFEQGAKALRQFMEELLLTPADMAESIGCTVEHFYHIQSGRANLTKQHVKILQDKEIFASDQISRLKVALWVCSKTERRGGCRRRDYGKTAGLYGGSGQRGVTSSYHYRYR